MYQNKIKDAQWKWKPRKHSAASFSAYCKLLCQQSLITEGAVCCRFSDDRFHEGPGAQGTQDAGVRRVHRWLPLPDLRVPAHLLGLPDHGGHTDREPRLRSLASSVLLQRKQYLRCTHAWDSLYSCVVLLHLHGTSRVRRTALCLANPDDCAWFTNKSEFCITYPKNCIAWDFDNEMVLGIVMFKTLAQKNYSREYTRRLGQVYDQLIDGCVVRSVTNSPCKNHLSVMLEDNSGYPHNCFAVESLWGQPDAIQPVIPVTGSVSMLLSLHPEEYFNYYDLVMAHVLMHEAHSVGNPIREGIALVAGKTYDIFVNQRVTERLPAPYNTNCTDYLALWRKNGGYGPLTGKSCAEQCKMQSMVESTGCVAQTISYPNNYTVCTDPSIYPADNVIEQCSRQCSDACREVSYSLRSEIKFDKTEKCNGDANCEKKDLFLNFIFNRLEIEKFVHEPRYEGVEMFSYIGGYMGMWLGISLVALFDFAETLVALLTYACAKKRSSTRPI
ncbi:uncharacterized protein CDAR_418462 [Caerostris darwini]|uniref:Uncharacterized protein n=1 Tax=Caerostris darwini TaxID=1538125 RepID=A0AAV4MX10_9ARAC|nr:uncharacterized protein CDAR_418462 [Caerostris darwini]